LCAARGNDVREPAVDDPPVRIFHCRGIGALYRQNLAAGQMGLSVALASRRTAGTTATIKAEGDVGKAGVRSTPSKT
jgi:hypothetical protein